MDYCTKTYMQQHKIEAERWIKPKVITVVSVVELNSIEQLPIHSSRLR